MKVKIGFYCTKEKKTYKAGENYTGKRKDIKQLLEDKKHPKTKKAAIETKKKK